MKNRFIHQLGTLGIAWAFAVSTSQAEETVTIPMSTYEDLVNRLESLEKRMNQSEARDRQQPTSSQSHSAPSSSTSPSPKSSIDDYTVPIPAAKDVIPETRGGIYGNYEYVYARPVYNNSTAFYVHDTFTNFSEGAVQRDFDYDLEGSHRFELGYLHPSSDLGWSVRYWQFGSEGLEVSPDDVDVKVGVADDPDIAIDTVSANDDDFLIATASTDLDVWDFEQFRLKDKGNKQVKVGAGVRYAEIQHQYFGRDIDPTSGTYQTALITNHAFRGAGPTVSVNVRRPINDTRFNFDFGGRGSLLFGSGSGDWQRLDAPTNANPNGDRIIQPGSLRTIPVGEVRMGISYLHDLKHGRALEIGAGFEGQIWINGGTPLVAGQDGATDSDRLESPFNDDFGVMGYYFRAGITY